MAGIPHHALDSYLSRLIQKGFMVAICEQMEDPKQAKSQKKAVVDRDIVRMYVPVCGWKFSCFIVHFLLFDFIQLLNTFSNPTTKV